MSYCQPSCSRQRPSEPNIRWSSECPFSAIKCLLGSAVAAYQAKIPQKPGRSLVPLGPSRRNPPATDVRWFDGIAIGFYPGFKLVRIAIRTMSLAAINAALLLALPPLLLYARRQARGAGLKVRFLPSLPLT